MKFSGLRFSRLHRGVTPFLFGATLLGMTAHAKAATYTVSNSNDSGAGSLRQAVLDANASEGTDDINFSATGNINLTSGVMAVTDPLTISAPSSGITIDGSGNGSGGILSSSANLSIANVNFTASDSNSVSGAINFSGANLVLNGCGFTNNSGNSGGAISISNANSAALTGCTFTLNDAISDGGAVNVFNTPATFTNCTFSQNSASGGGGVFFSGAISRFNNCAFTSNMASNSGGAIAARSPFSITSSTFTMNQGVSGNGGAISLDTAPNASNINLSTFSGNSGGSGGGAIFLNDSVLRVSGNTLSLNSGVFGGAIYAYNSDLEATNSTFSANSSQAYGGGIYQSLSSMVLTNATFSDNQSSGFGGAIYSEFGDANLLNCTVVRNSAGSAGGGISISNFSNTGTAFSPRNSLIALNTITSSGDASDIDGKIDSGGYNLIGSSEGFSGYTGSDLLNVSNPLVGNLANNGGIIQTVALQKGSPAINRGDTNTSGLPGTDARGNGFPRVNDGRVDVGAYESTNAAPVAKADSFTTNEDTPLQIPISSLLANDTDADGTVTYVKLVKNPGFQGALTFTNSTNTVLLYTPKLNMSGVDSFTYTIKDNFGATSTAVVIITVKAVNDAPVVTNKTLAVQAGVPATLVLTATDVEKDAYTLRIATRPTKGVASLVLTNGQWVLTYTANRGTTGTDTLTYTASDKATSAPATVSITISPDVAPQLVSVTPNGTTITPGKLTTFEQRVKDTGGANQVTMVYFDISNTAATAPKPDEKQSIALIADTKNNRFWLRADDGSRLLGPAQLGGTLQNSQAIVSLGTSDIIRQTDGTVVVRWRITPSATFLGTKSLWGKVDDIGGLSDGFRNLGSVTFGSSTTTSGSGKSSAPSS